jgi:hypothetical protein
MMVIRRRIALEQEVAVRWSAEFSHGNCPDCVVQHYEPYFKRAGG